MLTNLVARFVVPHTLVLISTVAVCCPAFAQTTPQLRQEIAVQKMTAAERDSLSRAQIRAAVGGRITRGSQDDMLRIEAVAPGFAGVYLTPKGELVAMLVDRANEPQARAMLDQLIAHREPHKFNSLGAVKKIHFVGARFSLSELISWQEDLFRIIVKVRGFQSIGVSETANAVSIGVTNETAKAQVISLVTARGIPAGAVFVTVELPIRAL